VEGDKNTLGFVCFVCWFCSHRDEAINKAMLTYSTKMEISGKGIIYHTSQAKNLKVMVEFELKVSLLLL